MNRDTYIVMAKVMKISLSKRIRYSFRLIITVVCTVQMIYLPTSFALKIQIDDDIKLRIRQDGEQERVGFLKRGTIVQIPDKYTVMKNGKKDLELTLNNWLRASGQSPAFETEEGTAGLYKFDGDKKDYFFPVTIVPGGLAPGSTLPQELRKTPIYIALSHLVRKGKALVLTEDASIEPITPAQREEQRQEKSPTHRAQVEKEQQEMEATSPCANGLCTRPSDVSNPVKNLIRAVSPALTASEKRRDQVFKRTSHDLQHIQQTFRNSCGFPLEEFVPVVKERARQEGIPTDILLALMTQESSGRCFARNSEADQTQSIGLFQIKSSGARYPRCTTAQKNILASLGSASRLATGPKCLENPLINLNEAIRTLQSKKASVLKKGFDKNQMKERDIWRLAVSAYNGGEKWIGEAKDDLLRFNRINHTQLNPNNWEDLRLFYFRSWLDPQRRQAMVGKPNGGRSQSNSVANLSYTENVVGRDFTEATRPSISSLWLARPEFKK